MRSDGKVPGVVLDLCFDQLHALDGFLRIFGQMRPGFRGAVHDFVRAALESHRCEIELIAASGPLGVVDGVKLCEGRRGEPDGVSASTVAVSAPLAQEITVLAEARYIGDGLLCLFVPCHVEPVFVYIVGEFAQLGDDSGCLFGSVGLFSSSSARISEPYVTSSESLCERRSKPGSGPLSVINFEYVSR